MTRLRMLVGRHAGDGLVATDLPGVSLLRATAVTEPLGEVAEPAVALLAQGAKETTLNGRVLRHGEGQFVVVPIELPVLGRVVEASPVAPLLGVVLMIRHETIAALLTETADAARPSASTTQHLGIAATDASPALLDAMTRLVGLLDEPDAAPMLAAGIEREIIWRLLTGPQGSLVRQIGLADSSFAHLARAIDWIRRHYDETLRIDELAGLAAMSATSFHRHFRALTSMTPIQFQKNIRLHAARAKLLTDPTNIAGAGFAVGYHSPSQFSREYRRLFGVSPSHDTSLLGADRA